MTYGTSQHALLDAARCSPARRCWCWARPAVSARPRSRSQGRRRTGDRRASTDNKCARCREIGADATINYTRENIRDALKTLTNGKGPDVVYDPVGGDLAEPVFRSIAWRGRYLVVGFAGGGIPALPLNLSLLKGAAIVGVFWGDFVRREPAAFQRDLQQLASGMPKARCGRCSTKP